MSGVRIPLGVQVLPWVTQGSGLADLGVGPNMAPWIGSASNIDVASWIAQPQGLGKRRQQPACVRRH
jgi:hypothetical protein